MNYKSKTSSPKILCEFLSASVKTFLASRGDSRTFQDTEQSGDRQPDKLIKPLAQVRP